VSSSPGEWPHSGLRRAGVAGSGLTLVCEGFAGYGGGADPVEIGFDVVDWKFEPMLFGMERLAVFFSRPGRVWRRWRAVRVLHGCLSAIRSRSTVSPDEEKTICELGENRDRAVTLKALDSTSQESRLERVVSLGR
jgi:hypothetical protein